MDVVLGVGLFALAGLGWMMFRRLRMIEKRINSLLLDIDRLLAGGTIEVRRPFGRRKEPPRLK